jgi:hypothetical protein
MAVAIRLTHEENGVRRTYTVWYADDPPERAEAVRFFQSPHKLFPAMYLPSGVHEMPLADANAYLRDHPIPELWSLLEVWGPVADDDLARLRYLPELKVVTIHSQVSDHAVTHLRHLEALESLVLYSDRVTDACLQTVAELGSLRSLDMLRSRGVSPSAFAAAALRMPKLEDAYPPRAAKWQGG